MGKLFRTLRADEIDCRVGSISDKGLSLLLYKDARCDMNILDETFGPFGWQRHHSRENANCIVSVYDEQKGEWIEKEDTGTESNTEAEKGLASDSFKRACFNWGIGRELYTSPFIWIPASACSISEKNGKRYCNDKFHVAEIEYKDGAISKLVIANSEVDVFTWPKAAPRIAEVREAKKQPKYGPDGALYCEKCNGLIKEIRKKDGVVMSAHEAAEKSLEKYGKQLCLTCANNEKQTH